MPMSGDGSVSGGQVAARSPGKIDCHTHTLPRRWLDLAERYGDDRWPARRRIDACSAEIFVGGRHFRTVPHTCWDVAARLEQMDSAGVAVQWLSTTPVMFGYWADPRRGAEMAAHINDGIAEMVREAPERFVGLATLPLASTDLALRELERAVTELGLRGVEIGTNVAGRELDDESLAPVFDAVADLGLPILVHPWDVRGADRLARYNAMYTVGMPAETAYAATALLLGGVLERLPALRILLAHGGGALAGLLPRIDRGWETWPDRRGTGRRRPAELARSLWADSMVGDGTNLELVAERLGWDRIVLGSDYPFPFGERTAGEMVERAALDEARREGVLWANARALLVA